VRLRDQGVSADRTDRASDLLRHGNQHLRDLNASVRDRIRSLIDRWVR
jgi:hypothetical protein